MIYYKIEADVLEIKKSEREEECGLDELDELTLDVRRKVDKLYLKSGKRLFLFVASLDDSKITLGAISKEELLSKEPIDSFFKEIEIKCGGIKMEEVTLRGVSVLMSKANRNHLIKDYNEVLEDFEVNALVINRDRFIKVDECILEETKSKERLIKKAACMLCEGTLAAEVERIYEGAKSMALGHPVHYMVQSDDGLMQCSILKVLLSALYANGRVKSRRYSILHMQKDDRTPVDYYDLLFKSSFGGVVVVDIPFGKADEKEESDFSWDFEYVCKVAMQYKNEVLTVFSLSRKCENIKDQVLETCGDMTFVELFEDKIKGDKAKRYLKKLAREKGVEADRSLYKISTCGEGLLASELNREFDLWYSKQLKTVVYPQYASIENACNGASEIGREGNAFEQLQKMIGLNEAKEAIRQVVDYLRAQELLGQRGIKIERPAMHMVFSGNPGTAKTTVARLFAQILKENGLFSKGRFIECGRADLVGKYVGWTAQLVRDKFREAKGGVLFIDEAYSLLDYKNGMYGDEAINTIVQEMENNREDTVVIFAGYPEMMREFIEKNPGLRSRVQYYLNFRDYNAQELFQILELMVERNGLKLALEVKERLMPAFERQIRVADFGNGRFIRNLFERARMRQGSRILNAYGDKMSFEELVTLACEDFEVPKISVDLEEKVIGFTA